MCSTSLIVLSNPQLLYDAHLAEIRMVITEMPMNFNLISIALKISYFMCSDNQN